MIQGLFTFGRPAKADKRPVADTLDKFTDQKLAGHDIERLILTLFLRVIAIKMIGGGVIQWARILGISDWRGLYFWEMPVAWQVSTVYFGVIELVAGVGLWMTVTWGTVMWVIVAISQIISHTLFADEFGRRPWELCVYFLTIGVFFILHHRANRRQR